MAHADAMLADQQLVATVYEALAKRHPKSHAVGRIAVAFEAGRDGFWAARAASRPM